MVYINGTAFHEKPGSCGTCPFFLSDSTQMCPSCHGICTLWDEEHKSFINPPKRCAKLFNAAFRFPDGMRLVITEK